MSSVFRVLFADLLVILLLCGCSPFQRANDFEPQVPAVQPAGYTPEPVPEVPLGRLDSLKYYEAGFDDRILYRQFYEYDAAGRLISVSSPEGYLTRVSDAHHFWIFLLDSDITDGYYAIEERYEYDEQDRLVQIVGVGPSESQLEDNAEYTVSLEYDSDSRLIRESFIGRDIPQITAELTYEEGLLREVRTVSAYPEFPFSLDFSYDEQGRSTMIYSWTHYENSADRISLYLNQYDSETGLLRRQSRTLGTEDWDSWETYEYDAAGGLTTITREWAESFKRPVQTWICEYI